MARPLTRTGSHLVAAVVIETPRGVPPPASIVAVTGAIAGCALLGRPTTASRSFDFATDTFSFANETLLEYQVEPDGRERWVRRQPRPPFTLRCTVVVRVARQFLLEARFDPAAPRVDDAGYRTLVRRVLARSPRAQAPAADPVVIPGFADLRSFSAAHADMLQEEMRSWRLFFSRSNWRLIFPFTPANQESTAAQLAREIEGGRTPIVRVHRYPSFEMNHSLLLYAVEGTPAGPRFRGYDPNDADHSVVFEFDRTARTFTYPRTVYFGGGPVKVYEIYRGWTS